MTTYNVRFEPVEVDADNPQDAAVKAAQANLAGCKDGHAHPYIYQVLDPKARIDSGQWPKTSA